MSTTGRPRRDASEAPGMLPEGAGLPRRPSLALPVLQAGSERSTQRRVTASGTRVSTRLS